MQYTLTAARSSRKDIDKRRKLGLINGGTAVKTLGTPNIDLTKFFDAAPTHEINGKSVDAKTLINSVSMISMKLDSDNVEYVKYLTTEGLTKKQRLKFLNDVKQELNADLFELLESLNLSPEEKKHRVEDRAKEWSFAIKLMATYGLRPIEVQYLEVRRNGKDTLWCTYAKKSGGGIGQARRLFPLHPTWEKKWNLIQKIKNNSPLPRMKAGAAEAFKNYMRFNPVWKKLKEKGCKGYSFRHAWAMRAHLEYGLHPREAAPMMGHSLESHQQYSRFFNEELLEESFERAIERRKATQSDKS